MKSLNRSKILTGMSLFWSLWHRLIMVKNQDFWLVITAGYNVLMSPAIAGGSQSKKADVEKMVYMSPAIAGGSQDSELLQTAISEMSPAIAGGSQLTHGFYYNEHVMSPAIAGGSQ